MVVNTLNYIESILNPNGRFKTLDGIYACLDEHGEPIMSIRNKYVSFEVVWHRTNYWLQCFFNGHADSMRLISGHTSPYLSQCIFLSNEIAIFDQLGTIHYQDVMLQQRSEGEQLNDFMAGCCERGDTEALMKSLHAISRMSQWLYKNSFTHHNIKPSNIIITPKCEPILINYESTQAERNNDDDGALCIIAAAIYAVIFSPHIYNNSFFEPININKLASQIISTVNDGHPLLPISHMILNNNYGDRERMNTLIERLAEASTMYLGNKTLNQMQKNRVVSGPVDFSQYEFVGKLSDNMIVVNDGGEWKFIDKHGERVINATFKNAYDFEEGRAVVDTGDGFGLIDHEGNFIIPPTFDDLTWDCENGIAIVMRSGYYGLYNRCGVQITDIVYNRIDECCSSLIGATDEYGNCGYLYKDGSIAIEFIYDEVSCFCNGSAVVDFHGQQLRINTLGEQISYSKHETEDNETFVFGYAL